MRILYVTAHYPPDFVSGATLQVQRLAEQAAAAGHDVAVFSGAIRAGLADGSTADDRVNGVAVRWLGTAGWIEQDDDRNWDNSVATAAGAAMLDDFTPDVVHAHALQTIGARMLDEALDRGVRVVLTMHDLWWWCARLFLVDRDMAPCSLVTDVSECACARTAEWRTERTSSLRRTLDRVDEILVPSAAMRALVIANGVDSQRVSVDANDVEVVPHPSSAPTSDGDVRFVYVGGDHPVKGVDVMLAAAGHLKGLDRWSLTCYGVEQRRMRRGLPVVFRPPFEPSQAGAVFSASDVLVIPSIARESFSLAAREALAAGAAVVTSDCLGPEEVVLHGQNGLVVPTGDAAALAAAMRRLVEDRQLLTSLQDFAARNPTELRPPGDHARALIARYGKPRSEPPPSPHRVVLVTDGDPTGTARHLAEALEHHGITVVVTGAGDPELAQALVGADAAFVHGSLQPEQLQFLTDAARRSSAVVIDAANILPGVSAAEIVAARPVEAARRRGILGGAATRVTIVAGGDSRSRMVESIVSDVVDHRRRTLLDVVVASEVERFRGADVAIIPPAADGTRAWMLASLAGAAAIVDVEIEHAVEPGRTALVARSDTEWTVNLTRLLDDPVLRTSLSSAAKREVMLQHGPHTVAASVVSAIHAASGSPNGT